MLNEVNCGFIEIEFSMTQHELGGYRSVRGPTWTTSIPSDAYQGVPPSFTSRHPGSSLTADEDEREEKGLEEVGGFVPRNQVFGREFWRGSRGEGGSEVRECECG